MNENAKLLESLIEKASDYGKTSFELLKLKTLDKSTDFVSSLIPHSVVFILLTIFLFFLNLGLAFYLGDLLGKAYYGFLAIAGFYLFAAAIIHFFLHKRIKRQVEDYFIKRVLK